MDKVLLQAHYAYESVDNVAGDPDTTKFKRLARLHQAGWREKYDLPIGSQPMKKVKADAPEPRPLGSRIDLEFAKHSLANFLDDNIKSAVQERLSKPQFNQTLNADRLYADLLSSMPMCFNLFGSLHADLSLADKAIHAWWPDVPGRVVRVLFEWSPGRSEGGKYLENRSAFDVAFELEMENGARGILGVETKYHEDCKAESVPKPERCSRYEKVARQSGIFVHGAAEKIIGTDLQQIWLDHLLALSIAQEEPVKWTWSGFVLVHPAGNPSYARAAERYKAMLNDATTFRVSTIESLLEKKVLPESISSAFAERYLW